MPVCGICSIANDNHYQQHGMLIAWPVDDNENHSHLDSFIAIEKHSHLDRRVANENHSQDRAMRMRIILDWA